MCLRVFLVFVNFLLLHHRVSSETCRILNHFIYPNSDLTPDYPKNDICRRRSAPNCCTRSVEAVMRQYANTDAHTLFFSHIARMRDMSAKQFDILQNMNLPYLSQDLRNTALQYKLVNDVTRNQRSLVARGTVDYLNMFYVVDSIPNFCKDRIIENMKPHVHQFLQELLFSHGLVQANWFVADDLFRVVFEARFQDTCISSLVESGMTRMSCKSCTDSTIRIPTCFDYCVDVVAACLQPFQPIILLFNDWFNTNVRVQDRLVQLIHYDRFMKLKDELLNLVQVELHDEFYADVCRYHFRERDANQDQAPYNIDKPVVDHKERKERKKRIAKTLPHTQVYSTRYISFPPTSQTPETQKPVVAGNQLFNIDMICFNATKSITNWGCWTGEGVGDYNKTQNRSHPTETPIESEFDIHLPRLKSKLDELKNIIDDRVMLESPSESNDVEFVEAQTQPSRGETIFLSKFYNYIIAVAVISTLRLMI